MNEERHMLTAEEGADRMKARGRQDREPIDDDPGYRCENCGHGDFVVVVESTVTHHYEEVLPCSCGATANAAVRSMCHRTDWRRIYALDEGHRYAEELDHEIEDEEHEELEREINCDRCLSACDDEREWAIEEDPEEYEEEIDEVSVVCSHCGHPIEFGWSHPDRGGRIWPVEAADFNPWRSWPEPRFAEAWERRGWIKPTRCDATSEAAPHPGE